MSAPSPLTGTTTTQPRFSFEVFPPRSPSAALALGNAVQHLAHADPDFIAVTYGASGSNREESFALLRHLRSHTDALPVAHLTSIGESRAALKQIIHDHMDAGIHDFLALRGDTPVGEEAVRMERDEGVTSLDLVKLIAEARSEREDFTSVGRISVAAYPNGHPLSQSLANDLDWLLAKQEAGASLAITQLFFYADDYLTFLDHAKAAGITMPILPGVQPTSTSAQLRKVAQLAGQEPPRELERALDAVGGYAPELGIEFTVNLCREVLAGGAPALHLYTLNRHEFVLDVCEELGLLHSDKRLTRSTSQS